MRRLTCESLAGAAELLVIRPTAEVAQAELARLIKERIAAAMEESLEQHRRSSIRTHPCFTTHGGKPGGSGPWRMNSRKQTSSPPARFFLDKAKRNS